MLKNNPMLKYLFTAEFKDGTKYVQNKEDRSVTEPDTRSCFFDVSQRLDEVKKFTLKGEGHTYMVDLTDGRFEVDGVPFYMHEEHDLKDFKLIFWRRHTHSFEQSREKTTEIMHYIVYRFGWQVTTDEGKNIQQVMEIN